MGWAWLVNGKGTSSDLQARTLFVRCSCVGYDMRSTRGEAAFPLVGARARVLNSGTRVVMFSPHESGVETAHLQLRLCVQP